MTTTIRALAPDVLEIVVEGRLEKDDYKRLTPLAEKRIDQHGGISMLIHVKDFGGWSPAALWSDLKFDVKHYADVRRIALVADNDEKSWMATLTRPFTSAEVEFFPGRELERARQWAVEGSAPAAALSGTG